jgi:hypothetical protein
MNQPQQPQLQQWLTTAGQLRQRQQQQVELLQA